MFHCSSSHVVFCWWEWSTLFWCCLLLCWKGSEISAFQQDATPWQGWSHCWMLTVDHKDTYRYWTGVTLLVRLIVAVVFSFTSGDLIPLNCHIITSVVVGILFMLALTKGVYRSTYKSILEMLFLINLFLFTVVSLAVFHLGYFHYQEIAAVVSISFSVILSCAICAVHAWWHCKKFVVCITH